MTTFVGTPVFWDVTNSSSQTDAVFRARCQAFHDALAGCGLVQTSDTGQINLATVTVGGSPNIDKGYEIWRFNDARQGVDPIFFKIIYGTAGATSRTRFKLQVGQGSNGSGTLTGQLSGTFNGGNNIAVVTGPNVTFYACHTAGFFGIVGVPDAQFSQPAVIMTIARTRDSSQAFDGVGAVILCDNESTVFYTQTVRWISSPATYSATRSFCIIPGLPADTALVNGDKQLYPHFYADPQVRQMWHQFTVRLSEISILPTSFSAAPIGGVSRTFLTGGTRGGSGSSDGSTTWALAFLWE